MSEDGMDSDYTDEEIRDLQQLVETEFDKQKYLLPKRYKIIKSIGSGAYGTVVYVALFSFDHFLVLLLMT
jgi:hypothetical protein